MPTDRSDDALNYAMAQDPAAYAYPLAPQSDGPAALDRWCAEHVMGWEVVELELAQQGYGSTCITFDAYAQSWRMLYGADGEWLDYWHPTKDANQAMEVLTAWLSRDPENRDVSISNLYIDGKIIWRVTLIPNRKEDVEAVIVKESRPALAICRAVREAVKGTKSEPMQDRTQERAEQMQDKTAAAIAWLKENPSVLEQWHVTNRFGDWWIGYEPTPGIFGTGAFRWQNDSVWGDAIDDLQALALVEHAWRVELEGRILAVRGELVICPSYDARNPYVIRLYADRRHTVAAPTLVEALAKAREATA